MLSDWRKWTGSVLLALLLGNSLSVDERQGREIFHRGKVAGVDAGTVSVGVDGIPLPTSSLACATCHGVLGEGSRESGIQAPPLSWSRLMSPAVSPVTGRHRTAYTPDTLRRAITQGFDPSGVHLYSGMPRYEMSPERLTQLISYLRRLGDDEDTDPGVTSTTIRIGTALPLSGPQEQAGVAIRETLELLFGEISRSGGIYGRKLELVAEDTQGTPEGLLAATRRLYMNDQAFVIAASLQAAGSVDASRLLESAEVPLIGPVTISTNENGLPNRYVFYLLPTLYDQARAAVDFIAAREEPGRPRLALMRSESPLDRDLAEGLRKQAELQGLEIVAEQGTSPSALTAVLSRKPDYLFFSGDGPGLARLADALNRSAHSPILVSFLSAAQNGASLLPPQVAAHALFVAPAFPPDNSHAGDFFSIWPAGNAPATYLGLRTAAFAAGTVLVQALRSGGDRPNRDLLIHALERFQHFQTGVLPPVTFGPNRRVGTSGAVILALSPDDKSLKVISDWITPKL